LLTLVGFILYGINPFFVKYAKFRNSMHIIAYISCLELVCMNAMFVPGLGGFTTLQEISQQMLPLYAFFMAGALPGLMTTMLSVAEVIYFYYSTHTEAHTVVERIYNAHLNYRKQMRLVSYLIGIAVSAFIGWIYETTHLRAHKLLDLSLQQVNQLTSVAPNFDPFPLEPNRAPPTGRRRSGSGSDSSRTHNNTSELRYSGGRERSRESPPTVGEPTRKTHKD